MTTLVLLFMVSFLVAGAPAHAQPKVSRDSIPPDIPAKLRAEIEKLHSADKNQRANAIIELRYMGATGEAARAVPFLIQLLGSDAEFPKMILWISSLSSITASCSSEYTFGGEAAETLARTGKTSEKLRNLMKHPQWRVRANAIRALGGLKDAQAVDQMLAALAKQDEHPEVRGNAALALGLMRSRRAVEPLIAAMKHEDPMVRGAVATALGALPDPRALQPMIAAIKDNAPHVRIRATISLGRIRDPSVLDPLLGALKDEHRQVREVAAIALRHATDPRVVEALIAVLDDPYPNVQINAAETLGGMKDPKAVEPLIGLLTDNNSTVRGAAATALGNLG